MLMQGRLRRAATAVALAALLACTSDGGDPDTVGGTAAPGGAARPVTVTEPEQRIELERQLGHHAMLVIDAMRVMADDRGQQIAAVRRTLDRNMDRVVEAAAGATDVEGLDQGLFPRNEALLALAAGEDADQDLATAQAAYGAAVADAVDDLSAEDASAQLAELDTLLLEQIDAYRDGELAAAYSAQRGAFSTAFRLGQQLVVAAGAAPAVTSGATELRSAMHQLLGEHTWLAVTAARRNVRGARDARHPAAALNGNTEDLTAALLSIYDQEAAVGFDEPWREAIAALMRFTAAATELDDEARDAADDDLGGAVRRVARQLSAMTEQTIDQREARRALTRHFRLLRRHSTALADNRARRAATAADAAYEHSGTLADLVAGGIAEHRPDEFGQE